MSVSRYDRQERVKGWKQKDLKDAKVVIVGCGALGNIVAPLLAGYGIGHIILIDDDNVELHNLARQIMFEETDVNEYKAEALGNSLSKLNSEITIEPITERIDKDNISFFIPDDTDVIVDCVDNVEARYILNEYALEKKIPLVHMGSSPTGCEIAVVTRETACLQCFLRMEIDDDESCTDRKDPAIGETNGIAGSVGAGQVRALIMKLPGDRILKPTTYISRSIVFNEIPHEKRKDCEVCSKYN